MGWSAEHAVHPLEIGSVNTLGPCPLFLSVCLPIPSHLWSPFFQRGHIAEKEPLLMLALKVTNSEKNGDPYSS